MVNTVCPTIPNVAPPSMLNTWVLVFGPVNVIEPFAVRQLVEVVTVEVGTVGGHWAFAVPTSKAIAKPVSQNSRNHGVLAKDIKQQAVFPVDDVWKRCNLLSR